MGREVAAEIGRLIEDGLARYGQGDLDGALTVWELVLQLDPGNEQANSYVDYVRLNYDMLTTDGGTEDESGPFAIGDDDPEYQIEIVPGEVPAGSARPAPLYMDPTDQGWVIADEAAREPKRPVTAPAVALPGTIRDAAPLTLELEADEPLPPLPSAEVSFDDATREYPGGAGRPAQDLLGFESPTAEFSAQVTEYKKRELGFVQPRATSEPGPEPGTEPPMSPRSPAPPPPPHDPGDELELELAPMNAAPRPVSTPPYQPGSGGSIDLDLPLPAPREAADSISAAVHQVVPGGADLTGRGPTPTRPLPGGTRPPAHVTAPPLGHAPTQELPADPTAKTRELPTAAQVQAMDSVALPASYSRDFTDGPTQKVPSRNVAPVPLGNAPVVELETPMQGLPTRDLGLRSASQRPATEDETTTLTQPLAVRGKGSNTIENRNAQILAEIDADAPPGEAKDDKTRRRITALLERATEWNKAGDHARAVSAIDLALSEEASSALAQKLVHRNRDAIMSAFQQFLGDLNRAPILSRPLHELAGAPISPRAAFLLSRVDGTLSLDEILDVSGMPRLEAYRYLCQLYLRGILR